MVRQDFSACDTDAALLMNGDGSNNNYPIPQRQCVERPAGPRPYRPRRRPSIRLPMFSVPLRGCVKPLINGAVTLLHPADQQVWLSWSAENPNGRAPGEPLDDGRGPLPPELVDVLLAALAAKRARMKSFFGKRTLSEDEVSDLDNDLSHLGAVERAILGDAALHRSAAAV